MFKIDLTTNRIELKTFKIIFRSLKKLKFKSSDTVYLGVNLGKVFEKDFKLVHEKSQNLKQTKLFFSSLLLEILKKYFYNGTIIVPSFYFEYFKKKKFNRYKSPTSLGFFENFFIKQKKVNRSEHPVFSISAIGKKSKIYENSGPFSFGVNSPFNKFLQNKVIFLNLGIKFKETCTYLHHVEHLNGINHRYYKAIKGKIYKKNKYEEKTCYSLVRFKKLIAKKAEYKIESLLKKSHSLKETNLKNIYISRVNVEDVYYSALKALKKNPSYFMTKEAIVKLEKN